ncbi:hypothetical protein D3C86_894760 [compost metagenome]
MAVRGRSEVFQQRARQSRIVQGHDAKSITRLIVEPAFAETEFVVTNLLGRSGTGQAAIDAHLSRIGILAVPALLCRHSRFGNIRHDSCRIATIDSKRKWQGLADPCGGRILEVDIAVDTRLHPLAAKLLEPRIDELARLAETVITGVAKRKHGKIHLVQTRRGVGGKCFPEKLGIVRHFTFAVSRGDDDDPLHGTETVHRDIIQRSHHRPHALRTRCGGDIHRQRLGIAGLGAEENIQQAGRRLWGGGGNRSLHTYGGAGMEPGQKTGKPCALITIEGRVFGNIRYLHHAALWLDAVARSGMARTAKSSSKPGRRPILSMFFRFC